MKINLTSLIQKIGTLKEQKNYILVLLNTKNTNIKTIELNGQEQILEESGDFDKNFQLYQDISRKIIKLQQIKEEQNTLYRESIKTSIKNLIIENATLKEELNLVKTFAHKNPTKRRVTETNNSYFEVKEPAFDLEKMEVLQSQLENKIQKNEDKIIQENSAMFDIDDSLLN